MRGRLTADDDDHSAQELARGLAIWRGLAATCESLDLGNATDVEAAKRSKPEVTESKPIKVCEEHKESYTVGPFNAKKEALVYPTVVYQKWCIRL